MGEGFPLWSMVFMVWSGREPLRDWICLSVSLCFCHPDSALSPFLIFPEIRNSDWIETFAVIFYQKLAFFRPTKGINRLTGGPRGSGARPLPRGPLGHCLALILISKNHIYSKKISISFYSIWTPFDMDFLRNKNMQQTGTGTGHWINMLVPKIV